MSTNGPTKDTPHNKEAEEALIGSVLINPAVYYELENELSDEDFYIHRNRWIWQSFGRLRKKNSPIDFLTLSEDLAREGVLGTIGGESYLTGLINKTPSSLHAQAYAKLIMADATKRAHIEYASQIANVCFSNVAVEDLEQSLANVPKPELKGRGNVKLSDEVIYNVTVEISDPAPKAIPCHIKMQRQNGTSFIYGLENMTQKLGGLPYGEAIVLAAPTQTGKTTLAYQLAEVAAFQGFKVHYASTESTAEALVKKRAMSNLGVSSKLVRRGELSDLLRQDIIDELNRLSALYSGYLTFDDRSHDVDTLLRNTAKIRPNLLVVDHLGEFRYKGENKTIGIEENFTSIRRYCHDEGIAFLCIHQVDIGVTDRPNLADLRWAKGGLSEKADIVLMMYRPDLANVRDGDEDKLKEAILLRAQPVQVEIWERKDRGGPVDVLIDTLFDLKYQVYKPVPQPPQQQALP